jgi:hypothetical protein
MPRRAINRLSGKHSASLRRKAQFGCLCKEHTLYNAKRAVARVSITITDLEIDYNNYLPLTQAVHTNKQATDQFRRDRCALTTIRDHFSPNKPQTGCKQVTASLTATPHFRTPWPQVRTHRNLQYSTVHAKPNHS